MHGGGVGGEGGGGVKFVFLKEKLFFLISCFLRVLWVCQKKVVVLVLAFEPVGGDISGDRVALFYINLYFYSI